MIFRRVNSTFCILLNKFLFHHFYFGFRLKPFISDKLCAECLVGQNLLNQAFDNACRLFDEAKQKHHCAKSYRALIYIDYWGCVCATLFIRVGIFCADDWNNQLAGSWANLRALSAFDVWRVSRRLRCCVAVAALSVSVWASHLSYLAVTRMALAPVN